MSTCSSADFPFVFYDANKELVNGTLLDDGTCVFFDGNCDPSIPTKECCDFNLDVFTGTGGSFMHIANAFIYFPLFWGTTALYKSMSGEEREVYAAEEEERNPKFITESRWLPNFLKSILLAVWNMGLIGNIVASIVISIFLKQSEQENMSVLERNSLAASEAFMDPYYRIFSFIEEIIMIRVSYAMVKGDKKLTDRLIHMGLAGVVIAGTLAGIIGTLLGVFDKSLAALTIPGMANDMALYPGCSFISSVDTDRILPYWLMESWALLATQIGGVLSGFFLGALEFQFSSWISLISQGVFAGIWFGNVGTYENPQTLLGIAEFVRDWLAPLLMIGFLVSPSAKYLRERTGLELSAKKVLSYLLAPFRKKSSTDEREKESSTLLKQGLKLMFIDIALEACMSCSVYLALKTDGSIAYQITALLSELPMYGYSYAFGMTIAIKIMGPYFLSDGEGKLFVGFVTRYVLAAIGLVALVLGCTIPFADGLAKSSGTNSCAYASSPECLPYFESVMGENGEGGMYTLSFSYLMFPLASSLEVTLLILRAFLLTLLEFDFMVMASAVALISYIPAICVVQFAPVDFQKQAIGYFGALYVPQVVLATLCSARLFLDCRKLLRDEPGPWSPKQEKRLIRQESVRASIAIADKAKARADTEKTAANYKITLGDIQEAP